MRLVRLGTDYGGWVIPANAVRDDAPLSRLRRMSWSVSWLLGSLPRSASARSADPSAELVEHAGERVGIGPSRA